MRREASFVLLVLAAWAVTDGKGAKEGSKGAGKCDVGYSHCSPRRLLGGDAPAESSLVLRQVVVVHRHGDRTPLSLKVGDWEQSPELEEFWASRLPSQDTLARWGELNVDPTGTNLKPRGESSSTSWPYGHLTMLGADQLRTLGSRLRERYVGLLSFLPPSLPAKDSASILQVRSTRYPRTINSVVNLLLGLYPADSRGADPETGARATVHIHSEAKADDYLDGGSEDSCPRLKELRESLDKSLSVPRRFLDAQANVRRAMTREGSPSPVNVSYIRASEVSICHASHGLPPLSAGMSPSVVGGVTDFNAWIYGQRGADPEISRLGIGPLLSDISGGFDAVSGGRGGAKMRVFSGHDSTLMPLLVALGAYDDKWPPYASYVALELLYDERGDRHLVRGIYNGQPVKLLGSSTPSPMPLTLFKEKLLPRMKPADWAALCIAQREDADGKCGGGEVVVN
eukprot:CAMPEP_0173439458 /NCGR_PEP_ID=MMETSP1357-20121228/20992_1 /TAXON_ID=77926 /ORGANISM="Hemiselmis rufescens, Strain PCC563" /LENGTH=455 /DNA_ID=CAMNT_0014404833 /DNA_START=56 /DNA_END=1423 /DNA_ORIENTATION=-